MAVDGSFVLARWNDEWIFRQLAGGEGNWELRPLNRAYRSWSIPDLKAVKGVVIQKSRPGQRHASKRYIG